MDKVVHFEILADDVERAQNFYQNMFGWKINKVPEMDYYMANTVEVDDKNMPREVGAINGGLMKRSVPGEPPLVVIDVPSIDDYLIKANKMGGKTVMEKRSIGEFGFYARISDTEENIIGLWQALKGH